MTNLTLRRHTLRTRLIGLWIGLALAVSGHAAIPDTLNYQGYLTNADGSPVDGTLTMTFVAFNVDVGGAPLWNQTRSITVAQGLFSVALADPVNPFPAGLFDGPVYLGLFVAGEELLPRRALTSNAYSFKAGDAGTLEGLDAAALNQSAEVAALEGDVALAQTDIANLSTSLGTVQADVAGVGSDVASVQSALSTAQADLITQDLRLSQLEGVNADITGISATDGLVGGGAAGNVTLGIGTGGVTSAMLADGSIMPNDMAFNERFTFDGVALNSALWLQSEDDQFLQLYQNPNGQFLDYFDNGFYEGGFGLRRDGGADAFEIYLGLTANNMFSATSTDVSLAGASRGSGYSVNVPSLNVEGAINIGREIVAVDFPLDVEDPTFTRTAICRVMSTRPSLRVPPARASSAAGSARPGARGLWPPALAERPPRTPSAIRSGPARPATTSRVSPRAATPSVPMWISRTLFSWPFVHLSQVTREGESSSASHKRGMQRQSRPAHTGGNRASLCQPD
ncbi:MAG: hypothetical protein AAFU65_00700 [Pseudomonadota bacterium]